MASVATSTLVPPRPRRKTAKLAAETISKALDGAEDDSGEEYTPESSVPPSSPKSRARPANKRRASHSTTNSGKKCSLSPETTEYLKNWMLSPEHIDHPYPTEEEKAQIMRHCGIEMKQLTNWFVNNRKRIWKPKLEELKRRCNEDGKVVPIAESKRAIAAATLAPPSPKRKKTGVLCPKTAKTHAVIKAANKKRGGGGKTIVTTTTFVSNPLDSSSSVDGDSDGSIDQMPPLPPPHEDAVATVTPLLDPMIISNFDQHLIDDAPMLPMTSTGSQMMPHSCNLVDPLTNKVNRSAQPCALCSACRDWNAGEFCPWDLTGIIGDISDDTSATATELTETTILAGFKNEDTSGSVVSSDSEDKMVSCGNTTTFSADADEGLSSGFNEGEHGISSFPSTASFPVPQEDRQNDFNGIDIDVTWD